MSLLGVMISLIASFALISGVICLSYFGGEGKGIPIFYYNIGILIGLLLLPVLYFCQISTVYSWILISTAAVYGLYGTTYEVKWGETEKRKSSALLLSLSMGLLIVVSNIQIFS